MDSKIKSEWDKLDQAQEIQAAADALTEEMKAESVLRQLTYSAVIMVADFFDPQRTGMLLVNIPTRSSLTLFRRCATEAKLAKRAKRVTNSSQVLLDELLRY